MGFEVKMVFVLDDGSHQTADREGPQGQNECVVWKDLGMGIDFGHITRLEKVVNKRFSHIIHAPFRRAGICVVDCFFTNIFTGGFRKNLREWLAPEMLVRHHLPLYVYNEEERLRLPPSIATVGGNIYLECSPDRLKGRMDMPGSNDLLIDHNKVLTMDHPDLPKEWSVMDPPLIWVPCASLAEWLSRAEETGTEGWQAILEDRTSLAIVRSWWHTLREMGEVQAKAVFRFS
jgi:hypothetical protein